MSTKWIESKYQSKCAGLRRNSSQQCSGAKEKSPLGKELESCRQKLLKKYEWCGFELRKAT